MNNKFALLIGNNYSGKSKLKGCHNDIDNIKEILVNNGNTHYSNFDSKKGCPHFTNNHSSK